MTRRRFLRALATGVGLTLVPTVAHARHKPGHGKSSKQPPARFGTAPFGTAPFGG